MFGLFDSQKNKSNYQPVKQSDSFLVDLRSIIKEKDNKVEKINNNLKAEKKVKTVKFKRNKFILSISIKSTKVKFWQRNFINTQHKRSWRVNFHSHLLSKYSFYRRKKRLGYQVPAFKSAKYYFQDFHSYAWKNLSKLQKSVNTKKHSEKDQVLIKWYRSIFAFSLVLLIIIAPFKILAYFKIIDLPNLKSSVLGESLSGVENLADAADNASHMSWQDAASNFSLAADNFSAAQNSLSGVNDWLLPLATLARDPEIKMAAFSKKFINIGMAAAEMGENLSLAGAALEKQETDKSWGTLIDSFVVYGGRAQNNAKTIQSELYSINFDLLPQEYQSQFITFRSQADLAVQSLDLLLSSAQSIKSFLGVSQDKRYLLVFQNNTEMRASGGFLGSYALVDIRDGAIRKLEVPSGGSYDTEAGMRTFVQSPEPLWLVNPRWYLWDANWWPDWPLTARSLMWFYEKSDGPTVDGVISFTPDVLEDLLRISGEIDLQEEYGLSINADNFWELLQSVVEKPNLELSHPELVLSLPDSPENEPKKIIGDLMVKIMERLPQVLSAENMPALLISLEKNLAAKNILLYFSDEDLQASLHKYDLDASVKAAPHDYLMLVHTNIAGQKTDRRMLDRVEHQAEILSDGSVIDTLTIYRTHTGLKNEVFSGVRNVDWLRVYVPEGSLLLSASGFKQPDAMYFDTPDPEWLVFPAIAENEAKAFTHIQSATKIYKESGKTVYANWLMTDPGETSVITLKYRLPFKLKKNELEQHNYLDKLQTLLAGERSGYYPFSMLVQKQPGAKAAQYNLSLSIPASWRNIWNYPDNSSWSDEFMLNRDILKAVLLEN